MSQIIYFMCFVFLSISSARGEDSFGYISTNTINIGDYIQIIAAKSFLPKNAVAVDKEFISEFTHDSKVKTVINGWFMPQKGDYWEHPLIPPIRCWPPSPIIDPFFISIHIGSTLHGIIFSEENIEYLKKHSPIGAGDLFTLNLLKKREIPSYFSGCLALTLENECRERNDIIYLVDLDEKCIQYIKSKTSSPVIVLTHEKPILQLLSREHRLKYAEYILNLYRKCKCVVTTQLDAAMPCLAFNTPVLMISSNDKHGAVDKRFTGMYEHTWHTSKEELLNGEINYNFDQPPVNPKTYLDIRIGLINTMTNWVQTGLKVNVQVDPPVVKFEGILGNPSVDIYNMNKRAVGFLPYNPVIVEIGAYEGSTTLDLAKTYPYGTIFAFEPNPKAYSNLTENMQSLKNVATVNLAVNTFTGSTQLWGDGVQASLLNLENEKEGISVPCVVLDEWCKNNSIRHIDFLRLDAGGLEWQIIQSSPDILKTVTILLTKTQPFPSRRSIISFSLLKMLLENQGFELLAHGYEERKEGEAVFLRKNLYDAKFN